MNQRLGRVLIFGIRIAFDSKASVSVVTPETLARDRTEREAGGMGDTCLSGHSENGNRSSARRLLVAFLWAKMVS